MRLFSNDVNNKPINWIEPAPENHQLSVAIVTGPSDKINDYPKPLNVLRSMLLTDFLLPNGTKLWVIGIIEPYNSNAFEKVKNSRSKNESERVIGILDKDPIPGFVDLAGD